MEESSVVPQSPRICLLQYRNSVRTVVANNNNIVGTTILDLDVWVSGK